MADSWQEPATVTESDPVAVLRSRARQALGILHSPAMKQLRQRLRTSADVLEEFAAEPRVYAATRQIPIPDDFEVIIHRDGPNGPRIDLHFQATSPGTHTSMRQGDIVDGCCYCEWDHCCTYCIGPITIIR